MPIKIFKEHTPQTLLIVGGARSGKSSLAQKSAEFLGKKRIYVATAQAFDDEMKERIRLHQQDRDSSWQTLEEPLNIADVITHRTCPDTVFLIDCLTLWLMNLMENGQDLFQAFAYLCAALKKAKGTVILVSNETGLGIVPDSALSRRFRDEQGRLNQQVASACEMVVFTVAGFPIVLKSAD